MSIPVKLDTGYDPPVIDSDGWLDDVITPEVTESEPWTSELWAHRFKAFRLGFIECHGDAGLTWAHDDGLNRAYDAGRALGRRLLRNR